MATTTITRADGSTVTMGGEWGDIAAEDVANGVEFDPTGPGEIEFVMTDVSQTINLPQQAIVFPPVDEITVAPATATKAVAATQQLTVTDSNSHTVTDKATYTTSDATKATVNSAGLITAVATGEATITAHYKGHTDTCVLTVS